MLVFCRSFRAPRRATFLLVLLSLSSLGACAPALLGRPSNAEREWGGTRAAVRLATDSGRFSVADEWLQQYASRHPKSRHASEAQLWRVLLTLDPANPAGGTQRATTLIDTVSATTSDSTRLEQLRLLRRFVRHHEETSRRSETLAREIEDARNAIAARTQGARPATERPADTRGLASEVQRLREELARANEERARANAELERVRRRVAAPRPQR